jgi:dipeptidyl aminopeptidase/acylaminoacyl peptidase
MCVHAGAAPGEIKIVFSGDIQPSTMRRTGQPMLSHRISAGFLSFVTTFFLIAVTTGLAQTNPAGSVAALEERVKNLEETLNFTEQKLAKQISDLVWFQRLGDIAVIDKVRYPGPPPRVTNNPTGQGAGNEIIVTAYSFIPKQFATQKLPLLMLVHGGVHSEVKPDHDLHIIREMLEQGYAILAPDYRGSTGYGRDYWQLIDYGALENEDVFSGKKWMLENHANLDPSRVGILGWSHGGMITLMNIFNYPKEYKVAYAGVPVSDLVARMGYKDQAYRDLFSAPYHIGKTAADNVAEYRRRSPAWNADKLQTPLLIHTTTNDEDVNVLEVEHLIKSLQAAGKTFEHRIYTNAPGAHSFNRLDTKLAKESRAEIWKFLAKHLNPPNPPK